MKNLLAQKKELGLIDPSVEITENKPKFMFAYAYDNSPIETQNKLFLEEFKTIQEPIPCISIENNSYLLKNNSELT